MFVVEYSCLSFAIDNCVFEMVSELSIETSYDPETHVLTLEYNHYVRYTQCVAQI